MSNGRVPADSFLDRYIDALACLALIREIADEYLRDADSEDADSERQEYAANAGGDQNSQVVLHGEALRLIREAKVSQ